MGTEKNENIVFVYQSDVLLQCILEYCYDPGYEYVGGNIGNVTAPSSYQCKTECLNFVGCRLFTYDLQSKTCWLKNLRLNRTRMATNISGSSSCVLG